MRRRCWSRCGESWRKEGRWCRRHWCDSIRVVFLLTRQPPYEGQHDRYAAYRSCSKRYRKSSTYLQCREVDHAVNVGMRAEDLVEVILFPYVGLEEYRPLAAYKFNSIDSLFGSIEEIVGDHNFVACFQQGQGGEGSNVAASSVYRLVYCTQKRQRAIPCNKY